MKQQLCRNVAAVCTGISFASTTGGQQADFEFQMIEGLPVIEVHLNDSGPYTFVLDTGASGGGRIDSRVAKELKIESQEIATNHDGAGAVQARELASVDIDLGNGVRHSTAVLVGEYGWVRESVAIDGVLGYGFLSKYTFTIDFPGKKLTLSDERLAPGVQGALDFQLGGGCPVLPLKIGDDEGVGLFDTGSDSAISMPTVFLDMLEFVGEPEDCGRAKTSQSEFDIKCCTLGEDVEIGDFVQHGVRAHLSDHWQYPTLGSSLFVDSKITIDHHSKKFMIDTVAGE